MIKKCGACNKKMKEYVDENQICMLCTLELVSENDDPIFFYLDKDMEIRGRHKETFEKFSEEEVFIKNQRCKPIKVNDTLIIILDEKSHN
jgi:hypothetical protein